MKKLILTGTLVSLTLSPSYGAHNCCGACLYNINQTECTENCCQSTAATYTSLGNGVIRVETPEQLVTCGFTKADSNFVLCSTSTTYICDVGYYGTPTERKQTCTQCPDNGSTAGTGATSVTECYVTSGTDSTGTFEYTQPCYYSN